MIGSRNVFVGWLSVVDYFRKNKSELEVKMEKIAENQEYGVEIFLSSTYGSPTITVMADDIQQYEAVTDLYHLEDVCKIAYDRYLDNAVSSLVFAEADEPNLDDNESLLLDIDDRESELDAAVEDFLGTVLRTFDITDKVREDIKEHFLEYLYRKHRLKIYRPMYLEDEQGNDFFEEYPYECMEFEDKNNPIYM